jgi:very-short-patch-repair endonuclease
VSICWEDTTTPYRRLQGSLPANSPPQLLFFRTFFKTYGDSVHGLPALLPEVWLHWDPVAARARSMQAFANHRMDFLMLLPGGRRMVFEIDGKQHYANGDRADPREYAKLTAGTRELQLAGYEVYRFGGSELADEAGQQLVASFFSTLFDVHRVEPTHPAPPSGPRGRGPPSAPRRSLRPPAIRARKTCPQSRPPCFADVLRHGTCTTTASAHQHRARDAEEPIIAAGRSHQRGTGKT